MFDMLCDGASKELLLTLPHEKQTNTKNKQKTKKLKMVLLVVPGDTDELSKWQLSPPIVKGLSSHWSTQRLRFKVLQLLGFQVPGSRVSVQYYNSPFSCQALQNSFILEELLMNIRVCG